MFDIGTATTLIVFLVGIGIGLPIGWLFVVSTALGRIHFSIPWILSQSWQLLFLYFPEL